jgi:histidinol-phosphate/aromatic aminotransferase/cobyric acid decarboxylase-like protein/choline kinase
MSPPTAVILAAGIGARLGYHEAPKALVEVGGRSIVCRALDGLAAVGVERVAVVVGHEQRSIKAALREYRHVAITYVVSDAFNRTNNAWSLWLARDHLVADTIVLDGDVVFEVALLRRLLEAARMSAAGATAVARWEPGMHGTVVDSGPDRRITRMLLARDQRPGEPLSHMFKTINVHLLRHAYLQMDFVPRLEQLIAEGEEQEYYERVIADAAADGNFDLRAVDCSDLRWAEVDDVTDLRVARYRFGTLDEQLAILRTQHGGFRRLGVTDHSLPTNHHFPPPAMFELMRGELEASIGEYPVGQTAIQELVAATIGLPVQQLAVANGASELIKVLPGLLGPAAVVTPAFNEYEAVFSDHKSCTFELEPPEFTLDVAALQRAAVAEGVGAVILASPGNPTSTAVRRAELVDLAGRLGAMGIRLILDESFVDFCAASSTLEPDLGRFPNLVIVKSMSKAYGIGGLRLGYLATADLKLAAHVRSALPIWNINGPAETFLRLLPGFGDDFRASVAQTRADCDELHARLDEIPGLHAHGPDANFVLVQLPHGRTSAEVVRALLRDHQLFVKDCAGKSMRDGTRYLRIASRTSAENARVANALSMVLTELASYPPVAV